MSKITEQTSVNAFDFGDEVPERRRDKVREIIEG